MGINMVYDRQVYFQKLLAKNDEQKNLPADDVTKFQYHITAIVEELGEVLKADKRWKTHRNETFLKEEKEEELADVFITVLNLLIFSGIDIKDFLNQVAKKQSANIEKFLSITEVMENDIFS